MRKISALTSCKYIILWKKPIKLFCNSRWTCSYHDWSLWPSRCWNTPHRHGSGYDRAWSYRKCSFNHIPLHHSMNHLNTIRIFLVNRRSVQHRCHFNTRYSLYYRTNSRSDMKKGLSNIGFVLDRAGRSTEESLVGCPSMTWRHVIVPWRHSTRCWRHAFETWRHDCIHRFCILEGSAAGNRKKMAALPGQPVKGQNSSSQNHTAMVQRSWPLLKVFEYPLMGRS